MLIQFVRTHRAASTCIWLTLIGALVGLVYTLSVGGPAIIGMYSGAAIIGGITAFEQYYVRRPRGDWLRRLPLPGFVAASLVVWLAIIGLVLNVPPELFGLKRGRYIPGEMAASLTADAAFSVVIALVANTAMRLSSLVGGRVLVSFLSGRYRHPIQEERIFLFLDLIGSTTIAERLGSLRYHAFLRDFIETIETPVREFGGEIYQYVGDEVVVTWPVGSTGSNGRAVACHFAMVEAIEGLSARFEKRYGAIPMFGCGIHCGEVVAGEIGDQRRQIVFVGDVVNTAARIEAQAKAQGHGLVVSETLLGRADLPTGVVATQLGKIQLKGKADPVELLAVTSG